MNEISSDSEYKNRLHESLSALYTCAINNSEGRGCSHETHRKEMKNHLRYLIGWINEKGGNIPKK